MTTENFSKSHIKFLKKNIVSLLKEEKDNEMLNFQAFITLTNTENFETTGDLIPKKKFTSNNKGIHFNLDKIPDKVIINLYDILNISKQNSKIVYEEEQIRLEETRLIRTTTRNKHSDNIKEIQMCINNGNTSSKVTSLELDFVDSPNVKQDIKVKLKENLILKEPWLPESLKRIEKILNRRKQVYKPKKLKICEYYTIEDDLDDDDVLNLDDEDKIVDDDLNLDDDDVLNLDDDNSKDELEDLPLSDTCSDKGEIDFDSL